MVLKKPASAGFLLPRKRGWLILMLPGLPLLAGKRPLLTVGYLFTVDRKKQHPQLRQNARKGYFRNSMRFRKDAAFPSFFEEVVSISMLMPETGGIDVIPKLFLNSLARSISEIAVLPSSG
jgi:hypothetical protein